MEVPLVPNTGRMVDYFLGGSHHFPIDVEAAKVFTKVYPNSQIFFQKLRDFNQRASRYIASQGINQFIVFAAGLPTCGNVHETVPQAKVLYTDIDLDNIQLGQEILADNPDVNYTFCDATNLNSLDESVLYQTLGEIQNLGIIFIGLSAFIPDKILANILDKLYDWAPSGSFLAIDFDGEGAKQFPQLIELLEAMGTSLHMRNPQMFQPLLGRWQLTTHGILPDDVWEAELSADASDAGEPVFSYGCVVYK